MDFNFLVGATGGVNRVVDDEIGVVFISGFSICFPAVS